MVLRIMDKPPLASKTTGGIIPSMSSSSSGEGLSKFPSPEESFSADNSIPSFDCSNDASWKSSPAPSDNSTTEPSYEIVYNVPSGLSAVYGDTLSSIKLPDNFIWTNTAQSVGNVGKKKFTVVYTDPETLFKIESIEVEVTVEQAYPTFSIPTCLYTAYGNTLNAVKLPNHFLWENPNLSVGNVGIKEFKAIYTPEDTRNYKTVKDITVAVVVQQALPSYNLPQNLTATYGDRLSSVCLEKGFVWESPEQSVGTAGTNIFYATYTPDNPNYKTINGIEIPITVLKATPEVVLPTDIRAICGQKLNDVSLPEGFSWNDGDIRLNSIGTFSFSAKYIPADIANFNTISNLIISVTVIEQFELDPSEYYCRTALSEDTDSAELLYIYDQLVEQISNIQGYTEKTNRFSKKTYCEITIPLQGITKDEFEIAYEAYRNDYPQHFWLSTSYTYYTNLLSGTVEKVVLNAPWSKSNLVAAISEFEQAADAFLEDIPLSLNEYETEKAIHDKLISNLTYSNDSNNPHNAYGALIENRCVCEGYAEAFQYLLYKRGILSVRVTGKAGGGNHAWNIVRINGAYYHADVTWDDAYENSISCGYFNLTSAQMLNDHTLKDTPYMLPICTETTHNYAQFEKRLIGNDITVAEIAGLLGQNSSVNVYVNDVGFDFKAWYFANVKEIAKVTQIVPPYSYSCRKNGYEYVITLIKT